jgi:predicted Zn-dependent protease with MMP-like domain
VAFLWRFMPMPRQATAPTIDDIEALARSALKTIPQPLRRYAANIVIRVEDFPDEETQEEMGLESPFDLLGLYSGVSLDLRGISDAPGDVDMIFLYRRPILDYWCETGEDLGHIVRHVLIHEIGHHFGFSDEAMHRIEEDEGD